MKPLRYFWRALAVIFIAVVLYYTPDSDQPGQPADSDKPALQPDDSADSGSQMNGESTTLPRNRAPNSRAPAMPEIFSSPDNNPHAAPAATESPATNAPAVSAAGQSVIGGADNSIVPPTPPAPPPIELGRTEPSIVTPTLNRTNSGR